LCVPTYSEIFEAKGTISPTKSGRLKLPVYGIIHNKHENV